MTPSLFDLPVRMGDAAVLAEILLDVLKAQPKVVGDDERNRVASRCASLEFERLRPCFPSIERDPVHPAAGYICADGVDAQPLLLRIAPATSPSSGLFPKSILIGRTHLRRFEVVVNAIPFGPGDYDRIAVFSEEVNKAFQPRRAGSRAMVVVRVAAPALTFPDLFEAVRRVYKTTGVNQFAFAVPEGDDAEEFYFAAVWAAIRAGWREGYSLQGPSQLAFPGVRRKPYESEFEAVARIVDVSAGMTADDIAGVMGLP